jgi:hypothetical protein
MPSASTLARVNGHWEIRLGGLVFSGLAATSFGSSANFVIGNSA